MKLSLTFLSFSLSQVLEFDGKCAEVPVIADFDLARYGGTWFEQARYPVPFQAPDEKCISPTYGGIDETTVSVNNSAIVPVAETGQWKLQWLLGTAVQVDPRRPNSLFVSFDFDEPGEKAPRGNYHVMDTDYDNYSIGKI